MDNLTVCTKCRIHHYDNCPRCLGFGLRTNTIEDVPITAQQAHGIGNPGDEPLPEWKPCPVCGSTPQGIPDERKK
jgi:RNA polymerase subunit RPABC4/transcription elongation factor Spt4